MRMSWGLLLSGVLTLLTALAACVAALGSHRAAKQSRRSTQAQVMNALFDMYESNALLDAEIRLRMWSIEHGKHFAHLFARLCRDDYAQEKVADHARRQLVHYLGTHLRRDTVISQWFQASKAAAASDGHAVHCWVTAVICQLSRLKRIPHYFTKIYILWNMHLIDKTVVQLLLRRDQVMFLREVVEPLETALHMQDEQGMFQAFGKLYRIQPLSSPSANPELSHETHG